MGMRSVILGMGTWGVMLASLVAMAGETGVSLRLDTQAAKVVLDYLQDRNVLPENLEAMPGIALLVRYNSHRDPSLTVRQFREDILACRNGNYTERPGTDFSRIMANLGPVSGFLEELEGGQAALIQRSVDIVSRNIPRVDFDLFCPIYIVLGGKSDFYVMQENGHSAMILDLQKLMAGTREQAWMTCRSALDHELFHVVFLEYARRHWKIAKPPEVEDLDYQLLFTCSTKDTAITCRSRP